MEWTDESIARLRALWQEGLSTAEIGRRMGITKNAVVGKAHRLDLSARPSPIRKAEPQAGTAQPKRPLPDKPLLEKPLAEKPRVPPAPVSAGTASPFPPEPRMDEAAVASALPEPAAPPQPAVVAGPDVARPDMAGPDRTGQEMAEPDVAEPEPAVLPDNVRLLRPDMPNPAVPVAEPPPAVTDEPKEPARIASRAAEPREPRRRGLTCCWPLGEPGTKGFHFCGGDPTPGKPYCAEHAALAYVKLRDRRDSVA